MKKKESNTLSTLSLVFGIIGIFSSIILIGIIPCVISLILGIMAISKRQSKGMAVSGIVCSVIGTIIFFLMLSAVLFSDNIASTSSQDKAQVTVTGSGVEYSEPTYYQEETTPAEPETDWATGFTPISDFRYTVNGNTITLVRYEGEDTQIMLSPVYTLNGTDYTLVSMGDDACFLSEGYITSVIIPEGVTEIGSSCFNSCASLKRIYLPSTLNEIPSGFLSYLHEYKIYCNSTLNIPAGRDYNNYSLTPDDMSGSGELGESLARALNGMMYGADSLNDDQVVEIYFGGTEEQWSQIMR